MTARDPAKSTKMQYLYVGTMRGAADWAKRNGVDRRVVRPATLGDQILQGLGEEDLPYVVDTGERLVAQDRLRVERALETLSYLEAVYGVERKVWVR
jgi:hypothetical protein